MPPAAEPYGSGISLVFDTSAWDRQGDPSVASRWQATLAAELLAVCPVVALERLAAARNEDACRGLDRTLSALSQAPVTRPACERALGASRERAGDRRLPDGALCAQAEHTVAITAGVPLLLTA
jgi:predicted nucleic acid-binding protein